MRDYRLGRLKGRWVVMWNEDDGRRRRYRLAAETRADAEREARDLIVHAQAPASGVTVAQVWEAYRLDMGERRQASKLAQVGKNVLPVFGHFAAEQVSVDDCRAYIARRRRLINHPIPTEAGPGDRCAASPAPNTPPLPHPPPCAGCIRSRSTFPRSATAQARQADAPDDASALGSRRGR